MDTCYHCSKPIEGESVDDGGMAFHSVCHETAARMAGED